VAKRLDSSYETGLRTGAAEDSDQSRARIRRRRLHRRANTFYHLRHTKFVGLREDKPAQQIRRE
jgi:hypothetical protein